MKTFFSAFLLTVLCLLVIVFATGCSTTKTHVEYHVSVDVRDGTVGDVDAGKTDNNTDNTDGPADIAPDLALSPSLVPAELSDRIGTVGRVLDGVRGESPIPPEFQ